MSTHNITPTGDPHLDAKLYQESAAACTNIKPDHWTIGEAMGLILFLAPIGALMPAVILTAATDSPFWLLLVPFIVAVTAIASSKKIRDDLTYRRNYATRTLIEQTYYIEQYTFAPTVLNPNMTPLTIENPADDMQKHVQTAYKEYRQTLFANCCWLNDTRDNMPTALVNQYADILDSIETATEGWEAFTNIPDTVWNNETASSTYRENLNTLQTVLQSNLNGLADIRKTYDQIVAAEALTRANLAINNNNQEEPDRTFTELAETAEDQNETTKALVAAWLHASKPQHSN